MTNDWQEINKIYLIDGLTRVRELIEAKILSREKDSQGSKFTPKIRELTSSSGSNQRLPALEFLCQQLGLSPFERDILLLCAGMELDSDWGNLCGKAQGDLQKPYPTFSLALAIFPHSHWNALIPTAALRRWRLIELGNGNSLTHSPLWIDERILHYLTGVDHLDERLLGLIEPITTTLSLVTSHQQIVQQLGEIWRQEAESQLPVLQLCGEDSVTKRAIAVTACRQLGLNLHALSVEILPTDPNQLNLIQCLCEREWFLSQAVLLLDCDYLETSDNGKEGLIARFLERIQCPVIVSSRERRFQRERPLIALEVFYPTSQEQRHVWETALGDFSTSLNGQIESLVTHFTLSAPAIQTVCWQFKGIQEATPNIIPANEQLWEICRSHARPRLDELAQRINTQADWDDLILPVQEQEILQEVAAHVRQRTKVYEYWGFARKNSRGLGISALFAGASGTGKTLAAEVLGKELRLDVYRIDLSSVVSKYIGETEKNLRKIFDAAEGCGAILLFDEADALFGKRSEVKDSHDRYANMEVSYLLQRIESYRGLAVLTSNLKDAIDQAFLRRIRFVIQFPFPDSTQRSAIWQRIFPAQTPTEGLDFQKLAKLNVAGGNIRNIAMNAAFLAADAGEDVQMKHILLATKSEYIKLERPLTEGETKGWV